MYQRLGDYDFSNIISGAAAVDPEPISKLGLEVAAAFSNAASMFGKGRKEADIISPLNNKITERLGQLDAVILGSNSTVPQLQAAFDEVFALGSYYIKFTQDPRFTDGRASKQGQATIMPLIDGTLGPLNGNAKAGPPAAPGGRLGQITDHILSLGGHVQPPAITQGPGPASLQPVVPGAPSMPQSGWLPPVSQLPQTITTAGFPASVGSSGDLLPIVLLAGAVLLFSRSKG